MQIYVQYLHFIPHTHTLTLFGWMNGLTLLGIRVPKMFRGPQEITWVQPSLYSGHECFVLSYPSNGWTFIFLNVVAISTKDLTRDETYSSPQKNAIVLNNEGWKLILSFWNGPLLVVHSFISGGVNNKPLLFSRVNSMMDSRKIHWCCFCC